MPDGKKNLRSVSEFDELVDETRDLETEDLLPRLNPFRQQAVSFSTPRHAKGWLWEIYREYEPESSDD